MSDLLREAYIQKLEEENDVLRERVLQLEELIGIKITIPVMLDLSAQQAGMLGILIKRDLATKEMLYEAVMSNRPTVDGPEIKIIDVQICMMRQRLKPFGVEIETVWGRGYRLTPATKKLIEGFLQIDTENAA